jgi:hypothetical protein
MTEGILTDAQVAAIRGPEEDAAAKRREKDRLRKQAERDAKKFAKEAELLETCREWWNKNREAIPRHELEAMKAQRELVLDQLHWMERPLADVNDADYVSTEEGVADLINFVKQHGAVRLGHFHREMSYEVIPPDWYSRPFWKNSDILQALLDEGEPTANYVKYGLLTALIDWRVIEFLQEKADWTWDAAAGLIGLQVRENRASYP